MIETGAIHIWAGLERAMYGVHPYGGDITEVYPQHLVPDKPTRDPWIQAGKTLYALLKQFCLVNDVCASINGRQLGVWMSEYRFFHKCDIRIYKNESIHSETTEPALQPIFQSRESEKLFRTIENATHRNKKREQRNDSQHSK